MLGHRQLTFDDYKAIARRRLWVLLIPTVLAPVVTFLVTLKLPSRYTSQTLVLVEQQRVPDSFVQPVVTQELVQRLATLQEQILSRSRLEPIIDRFGLYREDQGKVPTEDLVDRIRQAIKVTPIKTDASSRQGGMPGFYVSFTADNARTAQQVCSQITSMFIEENLRVREQRAASTTDFLSKQVDDAKRKLDEQDAELAKFQSKYLGQLPGQEQANLSLLAGFNTQFDAVTQALSRLQQEKTYAESLLSQQLSAWQLTQQSSGNNPETLDQQLNNAQAELVKLEGRYTPDHPDVIKAKSEVAGLQKKLDELGDAKPDGSAGKDNKKASAIEPVDIQKLRAQLHEYDIAIKEKLAQQKSAQTAVRKFQERLQLAPAVEEQFKNLTRDYQTALQFYNDLLAKKSQATMATDLERRQQGEQFQVMDPANLPEKPSWPNRPLITLFGLLGGAGFGVGLMLLLEFNDKALRTESDVKHVLKVAMLASIPVVGEGEKPRRFGWRRRKSQNLEAVVHDV